MDFRGQTAVLAAIFVLVGTIFLVHAGTEKALAKVTAYVQGTCGSAGHLHQCELILVGKTLDQGRWISEPTQAGTLVTWSTAGKPPFGDEKGSVTYNLEGETAVLTFDNPLVGSNKCGVTGSAHGDCTAGKGMSAVFMYALGSSHLPKGPKK
jgi:hypothetical protein